jgi:glutathione synthase/RimK-type ligase-like ATP-grasp enzyme
MPILNKPKPKTATLLYDSAARLGLNPTWVVPGTIFGINKQGGVQYINLARSPLNSHTSVSITRNKFLTRRVLEQHGIKNIPYTVVQTAAHATDFLRTHGKIIAKPLYGWGSRDIHIITQPSELEQLDIARYILEAYIPGQEYRYLVLAHQVIGVHRSDYGISVDASRPLRRISYPKNSWNQTTTVAALQATAALGLHFAAVDFMVDAAGDTHLLEVNSTPGLKWFHAPTSGPPIDVASLFLQSITEQPS